MKLKTLSSDQDSSITNAVTIVLPNSKHHFCMWHITKKIPEYLIHVCHQYDDFSRKFSWCIHAYVRTTFCAGMSTSQRNYLNSSTPMSVFVVQYDKAIDARYD
uniref:Protein FAR1-RELATED SEQUENCE n=1 Tax=Solanum lycopersicum TaxID=4081 RepID=A0A3Q7ED23_SOLLC